MIAGQEDRMRTATASDRGWQCRVHAKAPSLVRRRSNDTTIPGAAHDHGLARQFGMAKQFNRDEEGIHVGVQNGSLPA